MADDWSLAVDDAASWVARAVGGDDQAFAKIYDAYASRLYDFCRSILRDEADAADAAHDTFVIAHQKLDTLRDPEKLRSWLYSIARSQSLRRLGQRRRTVSDESVTEMTDDSVDLDAKLSEQDAVALVWDAAEGLSPKDRVVLDLNLRHGLAGQELADSLDVTRQNAYVLLDKMKKALSRATGALLVARYKRRDCEELNALLADWDGHYDALVRKRVARHIDSCEVCDRNRAALIAPERLFSIVPMVAAPVALRSKVMASVGATIDEPGSDDEVSSSSDPVDSIKVRRVRLAVIGATAAVVLAGTVAIALALNRPGGPEVFPVTTTAPAVSSSTIGSSTSSFSSSTTARPTVDTPGLPSPTTDGAVTTSTSQVPATVAVTAASVVPTVASTEGPVTTAATPTTSPVTTSSATTPSSTTSSTTVPATTTPTSTTSPTTSTTSSSSTTTSTIVGPGGTGPGGGG